jgi:hypothetical protein
MQLANGWALEMTKWFKAAEAMWERRGVKAVPYPVHLTKAGGGGGDIGPSTPWAIENHRRRNVSKKALRESPACQATKAVIEACNYKGLTPGLMGEVVVYGASHAPTEGST